MWFGKEATRSARGRASVTRMRDRHARHRRRDVDRHRRPVDGARTRSVERFARLVDDAVGDLPHLGLFPDGKVRRKDAAHASIIGVGFPADEAVVFESVKKAAGGGALYFHHFSKFRLRAARATSETRQHHPLRARDAEGADLTVEFRSHQP